MIEFSDYSEVLEFWNAHNPKIKCVIFYRKNCPTCDDFVPHVLEPVLKDREMYFDVRKICVDTGNIPFPPLNVPMVYFTIPNARDPMPLIRSSGATKEVIEKDLDTMIDIMQSGKTVAEAYFANKQPVLSSWSQQLMSLMMR